jgi:hypothetical protein
MAADDKTPTGRDLDKALDHQEFALTERHRQRLSSYEDEDSTVIEQRAAAAVKAESTPPRAKAIVAILNAFPPGSRPYVAVACLGMLLAALAYSGALTGIVDWAKK